VRAAAGVDGPLISVLMPTCETDPRWLRRAIESVRAQTDGRWELCIADDASTRPEVRQILEQRDWVLDQTDVKVQSVPFSKAARYRRPDWFTFHAFRNSSDPRDVVITDRRQNPTLPNGARWTF